MRHQDDKRAGRVDFVANAEVFFSLIDFYASGHQDVEHSECGRVIPLLFGNDKSIRLAFLSFIDGVLAHSVKVIQKLFLVEIRCFH